MLETALERLWIYTSAEMSTHILLNKFQKFQDSSQLVRSGKKFGHKYYSAMLERGIVCPHLNSKKEWASMQDRVKRCRAIMSAKSRKVFVFFNVIESTTAFEEAQASQGEEFVKMFEALQQQGCKSFELLAANVVAQKFSSTIGQTKKKGTLGRPKCPVIKKLKIKASKAGSFLSAYNFLCVGECTGLRLKSRIDRDKLGELCTKGRQFDLQEDPSKNCGASDSEQPVATALKKHPIKTVKRMPDGSWLAKRMD